MKDHRQFAVKVSKRRRPVPHTESWEFVMKTVVASKVL